MSAFVAWPAALPLLPERTFGASVFPEINDDQAEMVGWPALVDAVDQAVASSGAALVVTANYGEAGALEWYGSDVPVFSGHNGYAAWGPPSADRRTGRARRVRGRPGGPSGAATWARRQRGRRRQRGAGRGHAGVRRAARVRAGVWDKVSRLDAVTRPSPRALRPGASRLTAASASHGGRRASMHSCAAR